MKKKKSRLIVSLLTAFIMAFTVFPYMGAGSQVSAEEDPYIQTETPSKGNPITKLEYIPDGNGTFGIKITGTYDVYSLDELQKINSATVTVRDSDGPYYVYSSTGAGGGSGTFTLTFNNAKIVPGNTIFVLVQFCEDSQGDWPLNTVTWNGYYEEAPKLKTCGSTHTWNSGTVTTAATCKAAGVKTYKCTVCSTTKTEPIAKSTTHSYSGGKCTVCGAADPSAKVEEVSNKLVATKSGVKKEAGKRVILNGKVYLDSTVDSLELKCQITSSMSGSSTGEWDLKLYDPDGTEIDASYNGNPEKWEDEKFTKAGNYKYELEIEYTGVAELKYEIFMTVKKDILYTYKFKSLTATQDSTGAMNIDFGDFDSKAAPVDAALYRVSNGKIKLLNVPGANTNFPSYGLVDYNTKEYSTDYTYYAMDRSRLSATNKNVLLGVTSEEVALTSAHITALADSAVTKSNTVKTKDIVLGSVSILKDNAKIGITSVELEWSNALDGWTDSYIMESFNEKGQLMQTKEYTDGRFSGNVIYIPYEGVSKVKVTPCYTYKGVKMRNDAGADEISVKSAKIKAPGVNITKISNTKAAITTYKTTGATGVVVQQKVGKKYKTVTTGTIKGNNNKGYKGTTKNTYTKSWTKNKAGKTSYKVCSYIIDQGNVYYSGWKTGIKPKVNKTTYTNYGIGSIRMNGRDVYFRPLKIEYKGSKIKVTGKFYNTWKGTDWWAPNKDSGKFKITFKANHGNGKTVGYKTIKSGKMKRWSTKTVTFYLSGAKKAQDLRTVSYSVKTYY